MPLYYQFYEDILKNQERFHVIKKAKSLSIPFLIIHGTADEAVNLREAEDLKRACRNAELFLVEDASHTFGVKHPFDEAKFPEQAENVIQKTICFLKKI